MLTNASAVDYSYLNSLIGHLSGLAHLRATQLCTEALADVGLTPKQFVTLEFVANNHSFSQKEIAMHVGTPPAVMVGVLDVLTERGLVERVRSQTDRGRHTVVLTAGGEAIRADVKTAALQVESRLFEESGMTTAEWETLTHLLQKLTHREETG